MNFIVFFFSFFTLAARKLLVKFSAQLLFSGTKISLLFLKSVISFLFQSISAISCCTCAHKNSFFLLAPHTLCFLGLGEEGYLVKKSITADMEMHNSDPFPERTY